MIAWVIYDISKGKARRRVIKRCKFFGLQRVQKCVFFGKIKAKHATELEAEIAAVVSQKTDRVFIVPSAAEAIKKTAELGQKVGLEKMLADPGWVMVASELRSK